MEEDPTNPNAVDTSNVPTHEKKKKWPFVGRKAKGVLVNKMRGPALNYVPMTRFQSMVSPASSSMGGGPMGRMKPLMPNILDLQDEKLAADRKAFRDSSGRKWVKVMESR
jgi:hypothetical protein